MSRLKDAAIQIKLTIDQKSQIDLIDMIAEEEGVSFKEAEKIAKGQSVPVYPKWTLAFKACGGWAALLFGERNDKKREEARQMFRQSLNGSELYIFDNDPAWQYDNGKQGFYDQNYKSNKKKAKKGTFDKNDWKKRFQE